MTTEHNCNTRQMIKADWIDSQDKETLIKTIIKNDSCLNVCCGMSTIGQERIDINEGTNRTKPGDLFNLEYDDNSFDWVYCDPPFDYYVKGSNRFRWQLDLFKICKKGLITQRPKTNINMKSKNHEYYIIEDNRLSLSLLRVDYK